MSTETNKALVGRLDAILNTGELGQLDELCSPDMVNHSLAPSRPPGLAGTRQWLATEGRKFESFRWRELFVVAEGDLVVQFGVRASGRPGGLRSRIVRPHPAGPSSCWWRNKDPGGLFAGYAARPSSRRARWLVRARSSGFPFQ